MRLQNASSIYSMSFLALLFLFSMIPLAAEASSTESPIYRLRVPYLTQSIQGAWKDLPVDLETTLDTGQIVALDLRLTYDHSALLLTDIIPSDTERVRWEYFTSRFWRKGDSNNTIEPGNIRIQARGKLHRAHPGELPDGSHPYPLFVIRTLITNDRTFACQLARVDWYWKDCHDNLLQIDDSGTYLSSRLVLDSIHRVEIQDSTTGYPTRKGTQERCSQATGRRLLRQVDFVHGGPEMVCPGGVDGSGDLNLNGIGFDSADYALYNKMLLYGIDSIDTGNPQGSIAASELNGDGRPLTVSDLVFMTHVLVGDALPCRRRADDTAYLVLNDDYLSLSSQDTIGGLYLKIAGQFEPELLRTDASLTYRISDDATRILILGREPDTTAKLTTGPLLRFSSGAFVDNLVEEQASSMWGCFVGTRCIEAAKAKMILVPDSQVATGFVDSPFSPTTTMEVVLSEPTYAELRIFNVLGQPIKYMPLGYLPAGMYSVTWDGVDDAEKPVTSGIYFFGLTAGEFSGYKKLLVLK